MADQQLPRSEADYLVALRNQRDLPNLRRRVAALRQHGWTLRAIGAPLHANRATVRSWETHPDAQSASSSPSSPPLPAPPNLRPAPLATTPLRIRALTPDVPLADQARIRNLAPLARKVRGGTPPSSPASQAKQQLDELVSSYASRGVPIQRLAELAGVSYRAMSVRIDAHNRRTGGALRAI